jgi:hypothetical protein
MAVFGAVLRIRDVYPESGIRKKFIPDPDPGFWG